MSAKWTTTLAREAQACVSPLRRAKTRAGYQRKRESLERQISVLRLAMDQLQLSNPDGCDSPLREGTPEHVNYLWAATQVEALQKNIAVINNELRHWRASV